MAGVRCPGAIEPFTARLHCAAYCTAADVAEASLDKKMRWQLNSMRFRRISGTHASVAMQPLNSPNLPGGSTLPTAHADKGKQKKQKISTTVKTTVGIIIKPATQQSVVVHVAAVQFFELGLFINTWGGTQPANPLHVVDVAGGGKKGEPTHHSPSLMARRNIGHVAQRSGRSSRKTEPLSPPSPPPAAWTTVLRLL